MKPFLLHRFRQICRFIARYGAHRFSSSPSTGRLQLVLVTRAVFTFDYDGRLYYVGPGSVMLQSRSSSPAVLHLVGMSTERILEDAADGGARSDVHGLFGKFSKPSLPILRPSPTRRWWVPIKHQRSRKPRVAWSHNLQIGSHPDAVFGFRLRSSWKRCTKPLARMHPSKSAGPVYGRHRN